MQDGQSSTGTIVVTLGEVENLIKNNNDQLKIQLKLLYEGKPIDKASAAQEKPLKGKPLNDFLEFTRFFTSQASTVNRSLALAGIAIIWVFKKQSDLPITKGLLNFPLWCLAISLAIDLLQYFFGAVAWTIFYERKYYLWKKKGYDLNYSKDILAPNGISVPIQILFAAKIAFMGIAYWYIIAYLKNVL